MRFLALLLLAVSANASVIDYGPPQDSQGHWLFDIYDNSNNQRGTNANPFYTSIVGTVPVSGTFWQSVQPVSQSGSWSVLQSGTWTTGRTWTLASGTDSVASVQSGTWTTGRTWSLLNTTDSVNAVQSGSWSVKLTDGTLTNTFKALSTQVVGSDIGLVTNAVIHGLSSAGGGTYVDVKVNPSGAITVDASGNTVPVSSTQLPAALDGSGFLKVHEQGTATVAGTITANAGTNLNTSALALESGGNLASLNSKVPSGLTVTSTRLLTDGSGVTQPISAASLPLPSGAATSALQTTGNNSLATIATNTTGIALANQLPSSLGAKTITNSTAVNIASDQVVSITPTDGSKASYSASITGLVAANTPTDIFGINGSATKTIRVTRLAITGTQNTAGTRDILLVKRSTANSGGTSASVTAVPNDSNSAAATATVTSWTANPTTLGTLVGQVRTAKMAIPATNTNQPTFNPLEWNFGEIPSQAIVLRGTGQGLFVNLNSVTAAGNSLDIYIEWTEE